jgi:hypothetical protein
LSRKQLLVPIIVFLFYHVFYGQIEKEKRPLIAVIEELKVQFECNFSYADETIENIFVEIPAELQTLPDIVKYLNENTFLNFTLLESNFITISTLQQKFSICGYLVDFDTGDAIQNVTIQSKNEFSLSDEKGYFELNNLSKKDLISMQHLGYKSVKYSLDNFSVNNCKSHYLIPKIEKIREIVIRNYLTKGIRKTISGSFDIDYKNFGILPGLIEPDVLQTLQAIAGVQSADETVSNINIRGGSHHENLILWDGIKMYQSGHFFGLISAFNPYLTKRARLIKNGTEANLSGGVSGTILMYTDDNITQKLQTGVGVNLINADVLVDVPTSENSSLQLSARKSINDLVKTPSYKQYFKKAFQNSEVVNSSTDVINTDDDFSFHDINLRWLYQLSDQDKIRVNFLTVENNLLFTENAVVMAQEESKESSASQNNIATSVFYHRSWSDRFSTETQLYMTKYLLKSTNSDIVNQQRLIQENEVLEESIRMDSQYKLTDNLTLYNGYEYVETGVSNIQDVDNPLFRTKIKEVIRAHGLSSQLGYQSENRTTNFRAGLRMNYLEKFGEYFLEPRLSFSQRLLDSFTFEVLGELKHQITTQIIDFQNDFLGVENRRWILSNQQDIPIVKSKQTSVGLHYHKKGWLVSAEGYYKFVDGITSKGQGFQNQYKFSKTNGNYTVYGSDLLINKRAGKMSTWMSYSYVNNRYNFDSLTVNSFPNNIDIRHSVSLATTFENKGFKISSGLNWHSGKPTTKPVAGNEIVGDEINYQPANSSRLDDYLRVDMSAQYEFKLGNKLKAQFGLSIWNLLNNKNTTNSYYRLANGEVEQVDQTSLQSTPNASLRVIF